MTECGKCDRGWRVSDNVKSHCEQCEDPPKLQEWLFLAFHVVLVLVLHWIAIDVTAMRRKMTQAVLAVHVAAAIEVTVAAICTVLITHPVGKFEIHTCNVNQM